MISNSDRQNFHVVHYHDSYKARDWSDAEPNLNNYLLLRVVYPANFERCWVSGEFKIKIFEENMSTIYALEKARTIMII